MKLIRSSKKCLWKIWTWTVDLHRVGCESTPWPRHRPPRLSRRASTGQRAHILRPLKRMRFYNRKEKLQHRYCLRICFSHSTYRVFHRFGQAKFCYGGLVLASRQYLLPPQLPQKMLLASQVVIIDSKIIISLW